MSQEATDMDGSSDTPEEDHGIFFQEYTFLAPDRSGY